MTTESTAPEATTTGLSRRRVLSGIGVGAVGTAGAAVVLATGDPTAATATPASTATAATEACGTESSEQEVGPFYVAEGLVRRDITAGEDGIPLTLTLTYLDSTTCEPAVGLAVDIWQANAAGVYSDEQSEGTVGETYLRGVQVTDSSGRVTFTTVYPGWYSGRTNHIHDRVYSGGTANGSSYSYSGATLLYTGQYFFPTATNDTVATTSPYSSNRTSRTTNSTDRVYGSQGGSDHVVTLTGNSTSGYTGTMTLYVDAGGTATSDDAATAVTLKTSATTITAGGTATLSGLLRDTDAGTPIVGGKVLVTRTLAGKTATATVTTGSGGAWTLDLTPSRTATYEAIYAGDDAYDASTSVKVVVKVRRRVVLAEISGSASHTHAIVASGRVVPADAGVVVHLGRVDGDGVRHQVTTATTSASGHWTARWKLATGRHRVVAVVSATAHNAGGVSRTVVVRRT